MFGFGFGYGKKDEVKHMFSIICNFVTYLLYRVDVNKGYKYIGLSLNTDIRIARAHARARVYSGVAA